MRKWYYIALERYDKDGNRTDRLFVNERAFGFLYSFVSDVNKAKFFTNKRAAQEFGKNLVCAQREKIFYEDMYF